MWVAPSSRSRYRSWSHSPETPERLTPSRPSTGGRGAKCARNSSYVASTRWTCMLSSGRAVLDEVAQALEVRLEDMPEDRRRDDRRGMREDRRREPLLPVDDRGRAVIGRRQAEGAAAREGALMTDPEHGGRLEVRDRDRIGDADAEHPDGRLAATANLPWT